MSTIHHVKSYPSGRVVITPYDANSLPAPRPRQTPRPARPEPLQRPAPAAPSVYEPLDNIKLHKAEPVPFWASPLLTEIPIFCFGLFMYALAIWYGIVIIGAAMGRDWWLPIPDWVFQ